MESTIPIVTARSVRGLLARSNEAVNQGNSSLDQIDSRRFATGMKALGKALKDLEDETTNSDREVLVTARNKLASALQSLIAAGGIEGGDFARLGPGGLEIQFEENITDLRWITSLLQKLTSDPHEQSVPQSTVASPLPNELRVAVLGDWGSGLYGAPESAARITEDKRSFQLLLHLGDVYYSGTETEVRDRFTAHWPVRPDAISRAINGNHEMYSGGKAYFSKMLPAFGQESSYFALQNDYWTLIGLDAAYVDHDLDLPQKQWLDQVLVESGNRKVVLFSHHQPFSQFSDQGIDLVEKLRPHLEAQRIAAYYWGHIHKCVLFDRHPIWGVHGRCVGHGGIPYKREREGAPVEVPHGVWGWKRLEAMMDSGIHVPKALFLDGPNEFVKGKENEFGPQGYMVLHFSDEQLHETVTLPDGQEVWSRRLI